MTPNCATTTPDPGPICYVPALMSKRKVTKRTVATGDTATVKMSQRQRDRAKRALLKRRRQKSGQ